MFKTSVIIIIIFMANHAYSKMSYVYDAKKCPEADSKNRYITVPVYYDLEKVAKISNIPNLNLNKEKLQTYSEMEMSIYYEMLNEFDDAKETLIIIPGGPGQDHGLLHLLNTLFTGKTNFYDKFNVIAMDHRGLGCSRPLFPGNEDPQSLTMRYAASDIEMIRKELNLTKKINVFGYSYGSMLGQTYALLYPDSVERLFLGGAFSSYKDFIQAQIDFESLVRTSSSELTPLYDELILNYPDYREKFLEYSLSTMYGYESRIIEMPKTITKLLEFLSVGDLQSADKLFTEDDGVMSWMMRSISCIEIFSSKPVSNGFPMFNNMFKHCSEFKGQFDYFDYSKAIANLTMPVFIWGGKYDHVTPARAMRKMTKIIPNNFLYIDHDTGHGFSAKIDCFVKFLDSFFNKENFNDYEKIKNSSACVDTPEIKTI